MAKLAIKPNATSQTVYVLIADSASTTGGLKTGIVYNAAGFTAYYVRVAGSATAITKATQTVTGAWSSGGWVEVDATNCSGLYRFDVPDAVLASGVRSALVYFQGAAGMVPTVLEVDLSNQADAVSVSGTGQTARDLGASVLLSPGTGTGQVTLSAGKVQAMLASTDVSGNVPANVTQWLGTAAATPTVAGVPEVDVTYVNGSAATATAGAVDANMIAVNGSTVGAINLLAQLLASFPGVVSADTASTTTTFTANTTSTPGLSTTSGKYIGSVITFYAGTANNIHLARKCIGYTVSGSVGTFTLDVALPSNPATAGADKFLILGRG